MKRNLFLAALALAGLSGALVLAQVPAAGGGATLGQPNPTAGGGAIVPGPMGGDMKGMMDKTSPDMKGMMDKPSPDMKAMMEKMSPEMKLRCQMVMNTAVIPNDPAAVLALKGQLKLTDIQATQLEAINKEARAKAMEILTVEQKKTLDTLPQTPRTMMDLHEQMMGQMQTMMGGTTGGQMMNCPMMHMMEATPVAPAHDVPAAPKP